MVPLCGGRGVFRFYAESSYCLWQDLDVLVERCRDPALSVRKQAMQSLTDLLMSMPAEKPLQKLVLQYMDMYHYTATEHYLHKQLLSSHTYMYSIS